MSESQREYAANYCKPPVHTRFKKGQSGNPRGRPAKNLPALLAAALNEKVTVTENGKTPSDHQALGGDRPARQQISRGRVAGHQDADRHAARHRKESRAARCRKISIQRCRHRRSRDRASPYRSRRGRPDQWSFDAAVPDHAIIEKYLLDRVPRATSALPKIVSSVIGCWRRQRPMRSSSTEFGSSGRRLGSRTQRLWRRGSITTRTVIWALGRRDG